MTMTQVFPGLAPATYRPSPLHHGERHWPETNCYVDLLIEVLSAAGYEPTAALGFTVTQDFEGDQFTFFKFPTADLQKLFGLDIEELAVFDSLERHVITQIERGRLPLVEVDAYYLPDTRGVGYRTAHSKTSIGINALDLSARRMEYFHNGGFFALEGEDFDALFPEREADEPGLPLFPYCEFVKFGHDAAATDLAGTARDLLVHHLARRPAENPIRAYAGVFAEHAAELAGRPPEYFHVYAFNTLRQLGSNFELLASHLTWLSANGSDGLEAAADAALGIAGSAKTMQFKLARAMARQRFDGLRTMLDPMAEAYDTIMKTLDARMAPLAKAKAA